MSKCIICNNEYIREFKRGEYKYKQCSVCGASRHITNKYTSSYRKTLYDATYWASNTDDVDRNSPENVDKWLGLLSKFSTIPTKIILDFGAGRGLFTNQVMSRGFNCIGVDISVVDGSIMPHSIAVTNRLDGLPTAAFDGIVAIESFQHLVWPHYYMAEFSRIVKPGGCILLVTSLSDMVKDIGEWFYVNPPYHSMLYTYQSLKLLANDCCTDVVWSDNTNTTVLRSKNKDADFLAYYDMIKRLDAA